MAGTEKEWDDQKAAEFVQKGWLELQDIKVTDRVGPFDAETIHQPLPEPVADPVNEPSHYTDVPDVYEHHRVMDAIGANYHFGNSMKYLWRAGKKSSEAMTIADKEIQDVRKAIRYLEMWIELQTETKTKENMEWPTP